MTRDDLRTLFLDALAGIAFGADFSTLDDGASLREQLDLDSMDVLRLAQALHARLGIDVPELDYPELDTVERALTYLAARRA